MAVQAARRALADARVSAADVDLLVVATITPDLPMPAVACIIQHKLGLPTAAACFDLNAACSGFIYALDTACAMRGARYRHQAAGHQAGRSFAVVDWKDQATCALFEDGAGAVVLGPDLEATGGQRRGLLGTRLGTYGDEDRPAVHPRRRRAGMPPRPSP